MRVVMELYIIVGEFFKCEKLEGGVEEWVLIIGNSFIEVVCKWNLYLRVNIKRGFFKKNKS